MLLVLLIAVFVLAHYSGDEQTTKAAPAEVKAPERPEPNEWGEKRG